LGDGRRSWKLGRVMRRYRNHLQASTYSWGVTGYALVATDRYRAAVRWFADYQARKDVAPWILLNVAIALRATGADDEANGIQRRAIELPPDHSSHSHRAWLALESALEGSPATADHLAAISSPGALDPAHRFVHALAGAVMEMRGAPPDRRRQAFRDVRRRLSQAAMECRPVLCNRAAVARAYRRAVGCIAHEMGGFLGSAWACWRWLSPLLPQPR
jgi:hypothetical protein